MAVTNTTTPRQGRRSSLSHRRGSTGFLFVLPAVLFTLAMFIFPLLMTGWMSLNDWPLIGKPSFYRGSELCRLMVKTSSSGPASGSPPNTRCW